MSEWWRKKNLLEQKTVVQIISLLLQFNGADHLCYKPMSLINGMTSDIEECAV